MVLNGTTYKAPPILAEVSEEGQQSKKRFRFHLGMQRRAGRGATWMKATSVAEWGR